MCARKDRRDVRCPLRSALIMNEYGGERNNVFTGGKDKNGDVPDLRHRSYVLSPRCTARSKLPHSNSESNVRECTKGSPSPEVKN